MRRMEGDAINKRLRRFRAMVFSVADNRMSYGRKLSSNLILQSCRQLNPNEGRIRQQAFDPIPQFGTGRLGISRGTRLLKHSFPAKIVNQGPCLVADAAAHYRQVLPYRSMVEKLSHQRISIRAGLRKQQYPGGKAIDPMHDQRPLSLRFEVCGKQG